MKHIRIKSFELENFKGIKSQLFSNLQQENFIYGKNKAGKTTLFNSFIWTLFGKDANDRSDYKIKPIDENGNDIPKLESSAKYVLDVDGEEISIKRVYKEHWKKQRGALEATFEGNKTEFYWNDVPMKKSEFNEKVADLVNEKIFKLITNPYAFENLSKEEKRQVLVSIVDEISDEDIFKLDPEFEILKEKTSNKSFEEYSKQIKFSIKTTKENLDAIPIQISEVERSKPDPINTELIHSEIKYFQEQIDSIDSKIENKSSINDEVFEHNNSIKDEIYKIENEITTIDLALRKQAKQESFVDTSKIDELNQSILNLQHNIYRKHSSVRDYTQSIDDYKKRIIEIQTEQTKLREEWNVENSKTFVFDEENLICQTCKQHLPEQDIEEQKEILQRNFNSKKSENKSTISKKGKSLTASIENFQVQIKDLENRISTENTEIDKLSKQCDNLQKQLEVEKQNTAQPKDEEEIYNNLKVSDAKISKLNIELSKLKSQLKEVKVVDLSELKNTKTEIKSKIDENKKLLVTNELIQKADERINELKTQEKELAKIISKLELEIFLIEKFNKLKSDQLEKSVNKLFKFVEFKLFKTQVNGAEVPTCEALINGVPFDTTNTASQINAGLDIINTLCRINNVTAPIFIDNRESVTDLIPTDSQIINLVVDPEQETLKLN